MLAEQGLELQGEVARGDRRAGRLGAGQAVAGAVVGAAGAGRERGGLDRRAAGRGGPVLPPDLATQPATRAMTTTAAPSSSSRDTRPRVAVRFAHCNEPPYAALTERPNDKR